jgi:enoyl-CoA hydratase/carnithine racemase
MVLRGDGERAFAAGTDIRQFQGFTAESGVAYEQRVDTIMDRLASVPKPLIAAVRGYAVGGGLVLASACDLRYATPTAQFGIPVGRTLGNCLSLKNYQRVAAAFGLMRAKEMLFTGRLLSAEEVLQAGFVTALVGEEELLPRVFEVAQSISQNAPLTVWATKQAYVRLQQAAADSLSDVPFEDVIARVYGSEDFHEGVTAHIQKRRPSWQGR